MDERACVSKYKKHHKENNSVMDQLRVFIITQEEPFYIPKVIRYLTQHQNQSYKIVGASVLKPHRKNKSMKDWLLERTKIYTWNELFIVLILMLNNHYDHAANQ